MTPAQKARLEDLAWLADTGEVPERAAQRLGITVDALDRWCYRHPDTALPLWRRLLANQRREVAA